MTDKVHRLIELWQNCPLDNAPFILPEDKTEIQKRTVLYRSFEDYATSSTFGHKDDTSLHVGLLPVPYVGNLQKAAVFILMLNPGLSHGDYLECEDETLKKEHIRNLRQDNANVEFPFLFLDPRFAWHPGFDYWEKKLGELAHALEKKQKITYQKALQCLSQCLACLELMPYHSKKFGAGPFLERLISTQVMLEYVREVLIPKAENDQAIIVVARGKRNWDLPRHKNIIVYNRKGEARAARLSLKSRGGKAIANQLGL